MMKEKTKHIIKQSIFYIACGLLFGILINLISIPFSKKDGNYILDVYRHNIELKYYSAKDSLVRCIDTYISTQAKTSCMNGIAFVEASENSGIDPFFIMAQCQIESNFATTGLGRKTNSAFNIGAYDGKGTKYMSKYKHPDLSIEPYINVLKQKYIVNGITEYDLMHKYVNIEGKRYATDPTYEDKLYSIYCKLNEQYSDVYGYFLKMKTLSGK